MRTIKQELQDLNRIAHQGSAIKEANRPTLSTFQRLIDICIEMAEEIEELKQANFTTRMIRGH